MQDEVLDAEIKTRIPKQHKKRLREMAISRHLKVSDIMREAIRDKIAKNAKRDEELAHA